VDGTTTFQVISGWEATADIGFLDYPEEIGLWRESALDSAVALGINRLRLSLPSDSEIDVDYFTQFATGAIPRSAWGATRFHPVNDNADPFIIDPAGFHFSQLDFAVDNVVEPLRLRWSAVGEPLYVNLSFVHNTFNSTFRHKDNPAEYGELLLATFQHLESKYGWVPDGIEVILEPDELTDWTGTDTGRALVAADTRLSAAGYQPDFIVPSTANMANSLVWLAGIRSVPGAEQAISELAYHRYGGVSRGALTSIASAAGDLGVRTAMLEHLGSGIDDLLEDLVIGNNSAWQQYTIAFPAGDDGSHYFSVDRSTGAVMIDRRTKDLGQVFRYVRAGATRISSSTADQALVTVAFVNPDGTYVVVIRADRERKISVRGLPSGTYGVTYTTPNVHGATSPDVTIASGGTVDVVLPDEGVLTVFGR
jgi:hypothetical protein